MVDAPSRSPSQTSISSLDPDIRMDLEQQLEMNLEQIFGRYASYAHYILMSIKAKGISVTDFRSYLLNLAAFQSGSNEQCKLLSGMKAELDEADTINKIFDLVSCNCASFFNIKIFQLLVDRFGIKDTEVTGILDYPEHLKAYINMHKISEFIAINPALEKHSTGSAKITFKFDIELTSKLAKVTKLQAAVAKILNLKASALQLLSIEKGCVTVTFHIPAEAADIIFGQDKEFTPKDIKDFQALSVLWLECNGSKYNFSKDKPQDKTTGDNACVILRRILACMIKIEASSDQFNASPYSAQCMSAFFN